MTNYEEYKELMAKYKVATGSHDLFTKEELEAVNKMSYREIEEAKKKAAALNFDVAIEYVGPSYACAKYRVLYNGANLTCRQLALICDRGNLCFGYRMEGHLVVVYTD